MFITILCKFSILNEILHMKKIIAILEKVTIQKYRNAIEPTLSYIPCYIKLRSDIVILNSSNWISEKVKEIR